MLNVHAQLWPTADLRQLNRQWPTIDMWHASAIRSSIYQSRIRALRYMEPGDVLCFADDDMVFLPETDYDTPAAFIQANPHVGVVSCGMKRRPSDPTPPTPHVYTEAPLTGVMGGMLIGYDSAQLVLNFGETPAGIDYRPDDVHFAAACYVAGKMNYTYHGSVAVHEWGTPGGIIDVQRANPWMHAGHQDYFAINRKKKHVTAKQWKLDYTERAHAEHEANAHRWTGGEAPTTVDQEPVQA
jgi:hypothetical protein